MAYARNGAGGDRRRGVTFDLSVVNAGSTPIELTFQDACRADFEVYRDGDEIWRYSDGRTFEQSRTEANLQPGEAATFGGTWPDPEPGDYTVEPTLRVSERSVSARTPFLM
ncbi:BsuPI domain protein [Natronomonas moolapensis 8.8.11]|uniref:BsuPI domain protein n=1 Tax=Natronomonas moolapensis (strain DSM 18674 / CECT 7526 / JCM 14361 / 8.8.11) TaxID=268739 RepID=M1XKL8_NATM8|nr:BsuPI-related putative proteinase inhibitor [Natronomonas moolapensis]CCQ36132.1 BsuPI domain protein [Natronomonas moolapensis 8.8.11]